MSENSAPAAQPIAVEISTSSHPEFDLFASARVKGRQVSTRGDRAQIDQWVAALTAAAERYGYSVVVTDQTA